MAKTKNKNEVKKPSKTRNKQKESIGMGKYNKKLLAYSQ
jgi:hypothetical protein